MTFWIVLCIIAKIVIVVSAIVAVTVYIKENEISIQGNRTRAKLTRLTDDFVRQVQGIQMNKENQNEHK
jgi:hypothetical protein